MAHERIVAIGLLTEDNLDALGPSFTRAWPVDETPCFMDLLQEIDEADGAPRSEPDSNRMPINE
jgi:hypothetical protein